ncbi:ATP-dependent RNA helicase [Listeria floridensis FSL S10-1187]|uniref:DEAD-box ATP-dependent RNA helicase CshB n=1 Tax=Listeria floridensis FSL S10-1187 TaxID=1265817 RepID=A0ABN0RHI2_9LIST|nr:DEAD/DEAH box helicase [Listeria floridensis]EUJ33367.1 ATP-dependent RNA helicase [Listeria floridensis FSL S10-1187]
MKKTRFDQFGFKPFINEAINALGFYEPTPVQQKLIPGVLRGESIIGQSQTGTGKTHTFLLPILEKINPNEEGVFAVITAPSRELATQIYNEVRKITKHSEADISTHLIIGGTDKQRSIEKLKKQPHIVIGTPGRINDMIREQALFVHTAKVLVIDEADMTLDMGFLTDVDQIAGKMPQNLQMLVFSATIPEKLKPFLKKYMENPRYEHISPNVVATQTIEHWLMPQKSRNKLDLLKETLVTFQPFLAIVFANTKQTADFIHEGLVKRGLKVAKIHGDVPPRERKRTMKQIENMDFQYIVATDLAARGIDIQGISHVVNYELPEDNDFYIHRTGRTGRAGHNGIALTIFEPKDEDRLNQLEKLGISFKHVELKNGEFVETFDRNKRAKREAKREAADPREIGMRKKAKQKRKPGYKKKINYKMAEIKRRENRKKNRGKR